VAHGVLAVDFGVRLRAEKAVVRATANLLGRQPCARGRTRRGAHRDLTGLLHAIAVGRAGIVDDRAVLARCRASTRLYRRTRDADESAARKATGLGIRVGAERLGASRRLVGTLDATVVSFERLAASGVGFAGTVLGAAIRSDAAATRRRPE